MRKKAQPSNPCQIHRVRLGPRAHTTDELRRAIETLRQENQALREQIAELKEKDYDHERSEINSSS